MRCDEVIHSKSESEKFILKKILPNYHTIETYEYINMYIHTITL